MNKNKIGLTVVLLSSVISSNLTAGDRVLNVYNWFDYVPEGTVEAFEKETGIKVNYDVYDSNEALEAKLMAGGSGYDLVFPSGSFFERQIKAGAYSEIEISKLTNYSNLDQQLLGKVERHDPGNKYGVPYTWGTIGLGYNLDMVKARLGETPLDSMDLLLKPGVAEKLQDCGIGVIDSPSEVVAITQNYAGLKPGSEKKSELKQAMQVLKEVRPNIRYFDSGKIITDLVNGDICLALTYNGDVLIAQSRAEEAGQGINIGFSIPREGTLIWFDVMGIPADAQHKAEAHKFIDYMLRAETAAGVSNYVYYAVPNTAAEPLLLDDVRTNSGIYPDSEVKQTLFSERSHTAKFDRSLSRAWSDLKTNR